MESELQTALNLAQKHEHDEVNMLGYIVYANIADVNDPVALFRSKAFADYVTDILSSNHPPKKVESPQETDLEIDKYLNEVKEGLLPFAVNMYTDGSILYDIEGYLDYIADPGIAEMDGEIQGIYGSFWAKESSEAFALADQFRLKMIAEGKLAAPE